MAAQIKIANGNNNVAALVTLYEIDASYFLRYATGDPRTEWHGEESVILGGDGHMVGVGFPYAVWIFDGISPEAARYMRNIYCPGYSSDVTIRTYNKDENAYLNYNAIMVWPAYNDRAWMPRGWTNFRITFTNLKLISGFSSGFNATGFSVS